MKLKTFLDVVLNVNEKLNNANKDNMNELFFEVLHSSLMELVRDLTEKQYKNISLPTRITFEKLEKEIFALCSKEYQDELLKYNQEHGQFRKEEAKEKTKKRQIGYALEFEEGTIV